MNELIQEEVYQTIQMCFPSRRSDDSVIRAMFTLDTKEGKAIALSGGALWKGFSYLGSFDGFVGFQHNVSGADSAAADAVLEALSAALHEQYDVPLPDAGIDKPEDPEEEVDNG